MNITWDDDNFTYSIDGHEVDALVAKGASAAVASEANANIRVLSDRLQQGQISLEEWYQGMKRETKMLHMAQAALARGGFENMREQDWKRVEQIVAAQWNGVEGSFPGLRSFAEDIRNGRYGGDTLSSGVLSRAGQYADTGRATYENERLAARMEKQPLEARRVRGYADGCDDCVAWERLGWMPAAEMYAKYPIGSSVCGGHCYCAIVTRPAEGDLKLERAMRVAAQVAPGATAAMAVLHYAAKTPAIVESATSIFRSLFQMFRRKRVFADIAELANGGVLPESMLAKYRHILAPVEPHPFKVAGIPIASALELPDELEKLRPLLSDTLGRVHGDGALRKLYADVLEGKLTVARAEVGRYIAGDPPFLGIHPDGPFPGMTLFHEIGHWLDDKVFGVEIYGNDGGMGLFRDMEGLQRAIIKSKAVTQLRKFNGNKFVFGKRNGRSYNRYGLTREDRRYVTYLLEPQEMFARAYAQYITIRSGEPQLQAELTSRLWFKKVTDIGDERNLHFFEYWTPDDFAPIAAEFDRLFLKRGWMQRANNG